MGKVLRILVVLILVLGVIALVFASLNYNKREILIGRTHSMEDMLARIARTLEANDPPEAAQPSYPERDVSPVTSREIDNPERSSFWGTYNYNLESSPQPIATLDYNSDAKRRQMRQYYRIDQATDKPVINDLTGRPETKGPGTMDEILQEIFERAKSQYALLNATRAELPKLRNELIDAIEEVNRLKRDGRTDKAKIEERETRISGLEREKREIEDRVSRLNDELREIRTELQEANELVAKHEEDVKLLSDKVASQEQVIQDLRGKGPLIPQTDAAPDDNLESTLTPGVKGKIASFNQEWGFAVVEFTDEFMVELLGEDRSRPLPQIEVMVKRSGFEGVVGEFITRLRLKQVIRSANLVVADILTDWQQESLEIGDEVFF